jgi:hypothetical protein
MVESRPKRALICGVSRQDGGSSRDAQVSAFSNLGQLAGSDERLALLSARE